MKTKQVYFFIGTTAEFIKLAPVIKELKKRRIRFNIITSGQNIVRFDELAYYVGKISPYYEFRQRLIKIHLPIMVGFFVWTFKAIVNYVLYFRHELKGKSKKNTYFVVHGDTISSLLGAIIARMFNVTLVHIESGLRSFNFTEPFPEELCRFVVSLLADIHFCPNAWSVRNLSSVRGEKINTTQNTLIESFWSALSVKKKAPFVTALKKMKRKYFVLVAHRQEHVLFGKEGTESILEYIFKNAQPGLKCVLVMHDLSAPLLRNFRIRMGSLFTDKVIPMKLLPYPDFMRVLEGAEFIVTDGGSNQEESYYMGKPCLLIRKNTERIEGLKKTVILSKLNPVVIRHFLNNYVQYTGKPVRIKRKPSDIIVRYLFG
jgi:UDP-N-acetylglucosamine 2-epimerase (non-hydrolysing)